MDDGALMLPFDNYLSFIYLFSFGLILEILIYQIFIYIWDYN